MMGHGVTQPCVGSSLSACFIKLIVRLTIPDRGSGGQRVGYQQEELETPHEGIACAQQPPQPFWHCQ